GPSDEPTGTPVAVGPDARLRLIVRPATAVQGEAEAAAFLIRDRSAHRLPIPLVARGAGPFLVEGGRAELWPAAPPGDFGLVVAVARPGRWPDAAAVARWFVIGAAAPAPRGVQFVPLRLTNRP